MEEEISIKVRDQYTSKRDNYVGEMKSVEMGSGADNKQSSNC